MPRDAIANGQPLKIEEITLVELFDRAIEEFGPLPCMNFFGKRLTYSEVGDMVDRAAKGLQQQGIGKGSKVGLSMPNSPFYAIMMFAALKTGATVVNYNPTYAEEKLIHLVKDSGTDIMVTLDLKASYPQIEKLVEQGHLKKVIVCPMGDMMPWLTSLAFRHLSGKQAQVKTGEKIIAYDAIVNNDGKFAAARIAPSDLAIIQYTGGTTGMPKGAMLTHDNLAVNAAQIEATFSKKPGKNRPELLERGKENIMGVLPYFHIFGLQISMITAMKIGAEVTMVPDPRDINNVLKTMEKSRVTVLPGVPRLLQAIGEFQKKTWWGWGPKVDASRFDLSSLKLTVSGGDALRTNVEDAFVKKTGCRVLQGYGLSETSPVASAHPHYANEYRGTLGRPMPGTQIRIADPADPGKTKPVGEIGEICIKGRQVMSGYFNDLAQTKEVMTPDGYFNSRDLGVMDENGVTKITGRTKRLIIINGMNVYPEQIEEKIARHPSIAECCVVKIPDDRSGEAAKAFIRYLPDAADKPSEKELKAFLAQHLNGTEMPKHIAFSEQELKKTDVGKPDYKYYEELEQKKYEEQKKGPASRPAP